MNFTGFYGNPQLKNQLSASFQKGHFSHCCLLSGPDGSGKKTLATLLSAALQCQAQGQRPCRVCPSCKKVFSGTHPDVIWVDDPDRVTIPVETVRQYRADAFIRPNEGRRKIYCFPRAQALNPAGQNALLKLIEEPPDYAVFFLLVPRADVLLSTVRSRCTELHLSALTQEELLQALALRFPGRSQTQLAQAAADADGILGRAIAALESEAGAPAADLSAFAKAFSEKDELALLQLLTPMEKLKREQFSAVLESWQALLADAACFRAGGAAKSPEARLLGEKRTARELLRAYEQLRDSLSYCRGNIGLGHLCGALAVQLKL